MSWWILLAIPLSFLFHNVLHELAHGVVGFVTSGAKFKIWPFPGYLNGKWTWAHVTFDKYVTGKLNRVATFSAPVLAEKIWFLFIVFVGALFLPKWLVLLELIACTVDVANWFFGYWNPNMNPYCDAEKVRTELGFSRALGKAQGLFVTGSFVLGIILYVITNF